MTPASLIDRFASLNVIVLGEAMLDSYVAGRVTRICREAPVPIVTRDRCADAPGGAANTAIAIAALGAKARFLSVIGDDAPGMRLKAALTEGGVDCGALLGVPGRTTLVKERITAHGQLLMRVDSGTEADIDDITERRLLDALTAAWSKADAIIVSDYGYGIGTKGVIATVAALQRQAPRVLIADAKDLSRWSRVGLIAAKPNYQEAVRLCGTQPVTGATERLNQMLDLEKDLIARTGARFVALTLDADGGLLLARGEEPYRTYTTPAADDHAAGAGDTFTAALGLALAGGASPQQAADIAAAAATIVVAQDGTARCTAPALAAQLAGDIGAGGVPVAPRIKAWRAAGKRIVFTNGCFDILHHGHIAYLNRAKAMGDILIVGLNSDASVRALKGSTRPINSETDRAAVLAALSSVDLVLTFDAPTPIGLIETIRPDLYVKGGDYTRDSLPEAPIVEALGGEVKILPFLDDRSTSGIIERIRSTYS